jgi:hypothetical protein
MHIEKLLAEAQYVVDGHGQRKAVQLDLHVWESLIAMLEVREKQSVKSSGEDEADWNTLIQVLADATMDTGLTDLAHEHDHYLYGTPKRGND